MGSSYRKTEVDVVMVAMVTMFVVLLRMVVAVVEEELWAVEVRGCMGEDGPWARAMRLRGRQRYYTPVSAGRGGGVPTCCVP